MSSRRAITPAVVAIPPVRIDELIMSVQIRGTPWSLIIVFGGALPMLLSLVNEWKSTICVNSRTRNGLAPGQFNGTTGGAVTPHCGLIAPVREDFGGAPGLSVSGIGAPVMSYVHVNKGENAICSRMLVMGGGTFFVDDTRSSVGFLVRVEG